MKYLDDYDKIDFGQFNGTMLKHVPDWWFKSFWKNNEKWFAPMRDFTDGMVKNLKGYDKKRWKVMNYIESHFDNL